MAGNDENFGNQTLRIFALALSGTIISADPTDIMAATSAMSSDSWKQKDHPLHDLRPEGLKKKRKRT